MPSINPVPRPSPPPLPSLRLECVMGLISAQKEDLLLSSLCDLVACNLTRGRQAGHPVPGLCLWWGNKVAAITLLHP